MRRISGIVIALTLVAFAAAADEQSEHLEHLRMMMHAMSSHGVVIPQPERIVNPLAAKTIAISAFTDNRNIWAFTPNSFSVNQGDVVTLSVSVPSNDASPAPTGDPSHILLVDTYREQGGGLSLRKGTTATVTLTHTTPGTLDFIRN